MLRVSSATSQETPNISDELQENMSLLRWRKLTCLPSYLGFSLAPIWMVLAGSWALNGTTLASSTALKAPDEDSMARPVEVGGTWRHISLSSAAATTAVASSMLVRS
jgi:hypothetical protein